MVDRRCVFARIDERANQILKYAELAIPDERTFALFRTRLLDEMGHRGLRSDIAELLDRGGKGGA